MTDGQQIVGAEAGVSRQEMVEPVFAQRGIPPAGAGLGTGEFFLGSGPGKVRIAKEAGGRRGRNSDNLAATGLVPSYRV